MTSRRSTIPAMMMAILGIFESGFDSWAGLLLGEDVVGIFRFSGDETTGL